MAPPPALEELGLKTTGAGANSPHWSSALSRPRYSTVPAGDHWFHTPPPVRSQPEEFQMVT
jgi:hypothetical protein